MWCWVPQAIPGSQCFLSLIYLEWPLNGLFQASFSWQIRPIEMYLGSLHCLRGRQMVRFCERFVDCLFLCCLLTNVPTDCWPPELERLVDLYGPGNTALQTQKVLLLEFVGRNLKLLEEKAKQLLDSGPGGVPPFAAEPLRSGFVLVQDSTFAWNGGFDAQQRVLTCTWFVHCCVGPFCFD